MFKPLPPDPARHQDLAIALEEVAPPLWPLQSRLVFDCIEHPDKLTLGFPLKVIDTSEVGFP